VNTSELQRRLRAEGVSADAYDLSGQAKNETYVLRRDTDGWSVFYSERGLETSLRKFATETEACEYLLAQLQGDPTTH
jgi:hypothetical protein